MPSDAPRTLNRLGQSVWLDNITRDLLDSGTLRRYIDTLSGTGLTSNPTIFEHAIAQSDAYDIEIHHQLDADRSGEALFFKLAVQDEGFGPTPRIHRWCRQIVNDPIRGS